jgi:predicted ribosome-associated RNA-binding protein Tma20
MIHYEASREKLLKSEIKIDSNIFDIKFDNSKCTEVVEINDNVKVLFNDEDIIGFSFDDKIAPNMYYRKNSNSRTIDNIYVKWPYYR